MATRPSKGKKRRIELLFYFGADEHELARCFSECQKRLVVAGAKAQNLPQNARQASDILATSPPAALRVVQEWFASNCKFDEVKPADAALQRLSGKSNDELADVALKPDWRSVLAAFVRPNCPDEVIEFIEASGTPARSAMPAKTPSAAGADLAAQFKAILQGRAVQLEGDPALALVAGLVGVAKREVTAVQQAKDALAGLQSPVASELCALLSAMAPSGGEQKSSGFLARPTFDTQTRPGWDPDELPVLAQVSNQLPNGQIFAHVIGVLCEQGLIELSKDEARSIYKSSGDITAFPNTGPTGSQVVGGTAVWHAERKHADKPTQFVATNFVARVYDLIKVPHPSTDPDSVRQWLQAEYSAPAGLLPLFQLSDGLIVRVPGDPTNLANHRFDRPLDAYTSLHGFALKKGRRIVVGPLPAAQEKYDCSPPIVLLKRILRAEQSAGTFPVFSRVQASALCEFLESEDAEQWGASLSRAQARLEKASELRETLDEVIEQLIATPTVAHRIEAEIRAIKERALEELAREREAADRLREEQRRLNESLELAKKAAKEQEAALVKRIRMAFEKASAEGIDTLASLALYRGILGNGQPPKASPADAAAPTDHKEMPTNIHTGAPLKSVRDLANATARSTYATGLSSQLLSALIAAGRGCGLVGLVGARRELVVTVLSHMLSSGIRCSVSVSTDMFDISDFLKAPALIKAGTTALALPLGEYISHQSSLGRCSVIQVKGTNRAPPETFLPELLSTLTSADTGRCIAWADQSGAARVCRLDAPIIFLLEFELGKSTFPLIEPLSTQIPFVSVDHAWGDEPEPDPAVALPCSELTFEAWQELGSGQPNTAFGAGSAPAFIAAILVKLGLDSVDATPLAEAMLLAGRPGQSVAAADGPVPGYLKALTEALETSRAPGFEGALGDY